MKDEIRKIRAAEEGERIDKYLAKFQEDLSRNFIQKLIKEGRIFVEGKKVKASYRIKEGQEISIEIPPPEPIKLVPQKIPLNIIFEDSWLLVINKQPDLVVHPAVGHPDGTLVNALLYHCQDLGGIGGRLRPGIVHRLDRDTSGVMVVSKTDKIHSELVKAFKEREIEKTYLAIVSGGISRLEGWIDSPIGRHPQQRKKMAAGVVGGREAQTYFRVLGRAENCSLLELQPRTGRTHQLRVHLASINHPILGDRVYGGKNVIAAAPRQMLHSFKLKFFHPSLEKEMTFSARPWEDFLEVARESGLDKYLTSEGD